MSDPSWSWTARWGKGGFFACVKLFLALLLGICALLLPVVYWLQGLDTLLEATLAAVICATCGLLALAATSWQIQLNQPLVGMLLAMALRIMPPLTVCLLLAIQGNSDQHLGFVSNLLVFYLVTLAIETYLSVKLVSTSHAEKGHR